MLWYDKNIIHNIYFLFNNKRHGKFCYNVVATPTLKGEFTMSIQDFTTFMLSLPSQCKDFSQKGVILFTIPVSPHACPRCHELTSRVHDYRRQPLKTSLTLHTGKQIIYQKRRYLCPECKKVFSENHPFIARYYRIPYSDIAEVIHDHAQLISTCAIAERHDISTTTAARLFHMVSPSSIALDEAISIDEFKGNVGEKFQVVINSLTKRQCLNILPSRSPDKLYASMLKYPLEERMKVKYVSIDLCMAFHKMAQVCFPNAQIVADHFHAVRMANDALDAVRKEVQGKLGKESRTLFKHSRKLLLKREKTLTQEERHACAVLLNYSEKLSAAYAMKEAYFQMFESKDGPEFSERLRTFRQATEKQDIPLLRTLLQTTGRWKKELICGISTGLNNGFTEGCNTTIKTLKRVCYGFRNFENFKRRILFILNDEDRRLRRSSYVSNCA